MVVLVITFTPGNAVKSGWPGLRKMIVLHGKQLRQQKMADLLRYSSSCHMSVSLSYLCKY